MKKIFYFIVITLSLNTGRIFALDSVSLGLSGGANIGILDFNRDAMYNALDDVVTPAGNYIPLPDQNGFTPSINAALNVGIDFNKWFSLNTGLGFFLNVTDEILISRIYTPKDDPIGYYTGKASVNYTYSFMTVPVNFNFYVVNTKMYRFGLGLGPYFTIPLGDVTRLINGAVYNLKSGTATPSTIEIAPKTDTIPQTMTAGIQAGILNQINIKNLAITFDIFFMREFCGGLDSMTMNFTGSPTTLASDAQKKMSIFQGISASIGVRYLFKFKNTASSAAEKTAAAPTAKKAAPAAEKKEVKAPEGSEITEAEIITKPAETAKIQPGPKVYFIAVGNQAEGPFSLDDLVNYYKKGVLKANTKVWKSGMQDWQQASAVKELKGIFGNE